MVDSLLKYMASIMNFVEMQLIENNCMFGSMVASDSSSTNYPGKIPSGLDSPSDAADEKKKENDLSDSANVHGSSK